MCQIWCVIYKLELHTSTLLCCFRMSDNAKMPTYLILFEVHTFGWDVASMHGWVCYDMSVSICFHACVRETEFICDIYMCVRDKINSKCQREWQCTHVVMCFFLTEPICTKALSSFCCKDEFLAACCVMAFQHHQKIRSERNRNIDMPDVRHALYHTGNISTTFFVHTN